MTMGKVKEYIPFFVSSLISLSAIMMLLAMVYPEVFTIVPVIGYSAVADSTQVATADTLVAKPDSLQRDSHAVVAIDTSSMRTSQVEFGTKNEGEDTTVNATQQLVQQGVRLPEVRKSNPDTLSDADKRKMVQIFESMDAENAARILLKMDDYAIRQVIAAMKKRQSAKILAVLEPDRAARILNGKIEQ